MHSDEGCCRGPSNFDVPYSKTVCSRTLSHNDAYHATDALCAGYELSYL